MTSKTSITTANVNSDIADLLQELAKHEMNVNQNRFKYQMYRKAAKSVTDYPKRIESTAEAVKLPGVGPKTAAKIMDYITNGSIRQLDRVRQSNESNTINDLLRVSGIGPKVAAKLMADGINTIDQLKSIAHTLTDHQKIGLKYLEEFEQQIPRNEIMKIETILINKMNEFNKNILLTICGSFRRESQESGDIDVLMTHQRLTSEQLKSRQQTYLKDYVRCLEKCGLITDRISLGDTKFMGVCRLSTDRPHRRIDLRFLPYDQYFCGVLYFTGNDFFNQQMRVKANEMGFTLNEYSLRKLGLTSVPGEPIPIISEKEIFEYIDFPFKEPKDRNF
ncbi:DNA polymerase beta-like [Oppia nitens]|uniref:DNA polymerase beta-like n=1 Tax=Oppia nitens TaxID=1686743 RepID=UPI0023DC88D3|nr:DNA polymerase beta-like [Oppia nitens]